MMESVHANSIATALDHEGIPEAFWSNGRIDWNLIYAAANIVTIEDLKNALLALMVSNFEVAVAVHRAIAIEVMGRRVDRRHLDQLVVPPQSAVHWFEADMKCHECAGSEPFLDGPLEGIWHCTCLDRADRWSNCLRYRENLFEAAAKPEEKDVAEVK